MTNLEMCCDCDMPTGRAGIGEDSLYAGDYGPYCEECWSELPDTQAARIRELEAENKALREGRDDAISTLNAWFDCRELAHFAIDGAVLDAARGYLRTSRSGGMEQHESDMVEGVIADMARLSVFADLFARAPTRKETT